MRKTTRLVESVGLGEPIYSCGICCRRMIRYYSEHYGNESVIEVKSPNHWQEVAYWEDYVMVWCKL
jgi:hypothetical protein